MKSQIYNGLGHRSGRESNRGREDYLIDLTRPYHNMLMMTDAEKSRTFYWDGNVASMEEAGHGSYYMQDDLGSPMLFTDEEGEIRESYGYDEFGQSLYNYPEGQLQPFGYTGYQMEAVGGVYFAQARRYDAGAGRFVSKDNDRYLRFYNTNTLNQYVYCENNPILYTDPKGNDIESNYTTKPGKNDPVQVTISGNTVIIDVYVDITGDINTAVGNSTAHDLVIEGIEKWAGTYDNVYGYEATVEVNVHEGHKSFWSWLPWESNQNYIKINLIDNAGIAATSRRGSWTTGNTGKITMYTGNNIGEARTEIDYSNTIAHEFGHIIGVRDGYAFEDASGSSPLADMLESEDVMVHNHDPNADVSDIDIQMLIMAASTNEEQFFMAYGENQQSKGAYIYGMCDTN